MKNLKLHMPSAYTVLIFIIFIIAGITHFIPEVKSITFAQALTAPVAGFAKGMDVSLFVIILGGFLGIINKTGALTSGIGIVVKKLNGKEIYIIPAIMFLISLGGTTYGMYEETLALIALISATLVAAGFDTITAMATIFLGSCCGVMGSTVNPFVVSVSVDALKGVGIIANQALIIGVGVVSWLSMLLIASIMVMRYAKKVKANRTENTLLTAFEQENMHKEFDQGNNEHIEFTFKQKVVLVLFALTFLVMIISLIPWGSFGITLFHNTDFLTGNNLGDWWFSDISTWFLLMSVIIGVMYRIREKDLVSSFLVGAADMIGVALVIGVSRGISVIMAASGLDLYVLTNASNALSGINSVLFTAGAFVIYLGLAFLIPSTSGLATVSIPIFGALATKLGLPPEVMIIVLSGACALINTTCPTSGALMGGLGIARVEYSTWVKFIWKIALLMIVVDIIILSGAMLIL